MEYISTKDLARIWKVSPTRIVVMAKQGKIEGAKLVGKSWLFPSDIKKPVDGRTKFAQRNEKFIFPAYISLNYLDETFLTTLDDEEKEFLELEKSLCSGDYGLDNKDKLLKIIKNSKNKLLVIGAYHYLFDLSLMNKNYKQALVYYHQLANLIEKNDYRDSLAPLLGEIESFIRPNEKNSVYVIDPRKQIERTSIPYYLLNTIYFNLIETISKKALPNTSVYELAIKEYDDEHYPYIATYLHLVLSLLYRYLKNDSLFDYHIDKACRLGSKHRFLTPFTVFYSHISQQIDTVMARYDIEFLQAIQKGAATYTDVYSSLVNYISNSNGVFNLRTSDFKYLAYLLEEKTNKEIANLEKISVQAVYKKYNQLCYKFSVENKEELHDAYLKLLNGIGE